MHSAKLTLFTRQNCSLCDTAKAVLKNLEKKRSFELSEIDVMTSGQKEWKDVYEFDTPVVWFL
jgi:glutaredoxin